MVTSQKAISVVSTIEIIRKDYGEEKMQEVFYSLNDSDRTVVANEGLLASSWLDIGLTQRFFEAVEIPKLLNFAFWTSISVGVDIKNIIEEELYQNQNLQIHYCR